MMVYLLTTCCMILAAGVCSISYVVVNKRLQNSKLQSTDTVDADESASDSSLPAEKAAEEGFRKTPFSVKGFISDVREGFAIAPASRWTVFAISVLLVGPLNGMAWE